VQTEKENNPIQEEETTRLSQKQDAPEEEREKDDSAPGEEAQPDQLELLQQKYDEQSDRLLRLMAEYDNFRKRSQKEKDEMYQNALVASVSKFLPVLDNLERAEQYPRDSEDFKEGLDLIFQELKETMTNMGLVPFGEVGEAFDVEKHHAVLHIEDEALGENVVSQVLQKGYKLGERIVRYAMVQTAN